MNTLDHFAKDMRVQYVGPMNGKPLHPDRVGKKGKVIRTVKKRKCVCIQWDDTGNWYDALPENLVRTD